MTVDNLTPYSISSNDILTTIYDITRAVFRHLPIRSLDSCTLVCQSWADLARRLKSQRSCIQTFAYQTDSFLSQNFNESISPFIHDKLWSIPSFALVVVTRNLDERGFASQSSSSSVTKSSRRSKAQQTARHTEHIDTSQVLTHHLNRSCRIFTIVSSGIIVTNDSNQSKEIETTDGLGMILFPKFPSNIFQIYPFSIPANCKISPNMSRSDLHQLLGGIPDDVPIRCVLFFVVNRQSQVLKCMQNLVKNYPSKLVIAGGFVEQVEQSKNTCGIVLTGDENHLNIRQIVLESHLQTIEQINSKLTKLKSNEDSSKFSFAIQLSCVARGEDFYGNENVECTQFRNLFPRTPLIGIFGNGEIGHDYLSNESIQSADDLFLTYSTVFTLISIN